MGSPVMVSQWFKLDEAQEERARKLHAKALIIDCLGGHIVSPEPPPVDGKSYLDRLVESGVRGVNVTLAAHADDFDDALWEMYHYFNLLTARPDKTLHVERAEDLERAHQEGKVGIIFGFQAATPIGTHIERWTVLHKLGLRVCQLTYMERTIFGDGCFEPENRGLTSYGRQAVGEMNRLGIVVDLSHGGERTTLDIMEISEDPVIFSHANPIKLGPSKRNITDQQIKTCAAKGGVVGITPHSELTYRKPGVRPTIRDYMDHVDYVAQLVGPDHVGIGSDVFESYTKVSWEAQTKRMYKSQWVFETMLSDGFSRMTDLPEVTRGLVARGYSDEDVLKILGANWLRVFRKVWSKTVGVA
jgi:membrane dipeptidase